MLESKRYRKQGHKLHTLSCKACHKEFSSTIKTKILCNDCLKESKLLCDVSNKYEYQFDGKEIWCHRTIAKNLLQRNLTFNEIVHHVDGDSQNNNLVNLWVMGRGNHATLHGFLRTEQIIYLKNKENYIEKDWKTRQIKLSNQFIKDNNFKVIKLSKINNRSIVQ